MGENHIPPLKSDFGILGEAGAFKGRLFREEKKSL
jgi:hypothetical protein